MARQYSKNLLGSSILYCRKKELLWKIRLAFVLAITTTSNIGDDLDEEWFGWWLYIIKWEGVWIFRWRWG
jgi:hypothetical protein